MKIFVFYRNTLLYFMDLFIYTHLLLPTKLLPIKLLPIKLLPIKLLPIRLVIFYEPHMKNVQNLTCLSNTRTILARDACGGVDRWLQLFTDCTHNPKPLESQLQSNASGFLRPFLPYRKRTSLHPVTVVALQAADAPLGHVTGALAPKCCVWFLWMCAPFYVPR